MVDDELAALRARFPTWGFLRLSTGRLAGYLVAVHHTYAPQPIVARNADELRRKITDEVGKTPARPARPAPQAPDHWLPPSPRVARALLSRIPQQAKDQYLIELLHLHQREPQQDVVICTRCRKPIDRCDVNRLRALHIDPYLDAHS